MNLFRFIIFLFAIHLPAYGQVFAEHAPPPRLHARAYLLVDVTSNTVLAEKSADERIEPASLTKLMTAYLVFDALRKKQFTPDHRVAVSQAARQAPGSRMFLEEGSDVAIEDLLKGLIIQSGNDAAIALAEAVAGSEERFAVMMNREAERLNMTNTRFANATGLPASHHYSSARDLLYLSAQIIGRFPEYFPLYSMREFTWNNIPQYNRNKLLGRDPHVDGLKTGFTESAGFCLIATALRGERRLVSVVIDAGSDRGRTSESQRLLNFGFESFDTIRLYSGGETVDDIPVWKGGDDHLAAGFEEDLFVTIPKGLGGKLQAKLESMQPLLAPVRKGQSIGMLRLTFDGNPYGEFPVIALKSVPIANIFVRAWHSLKLLLD